MYRYLIGFAVGLIVNAMLACFWMHGAWPAWAKFVAACWASGTFGFAACCLLVAAAKPEPKSRKRHTPLVTRDRHIVRL